jgi:hypothetical protein
MRVPNRAVDTDFTGHGKGTVFKARHSSHSDEHFSIDKTCQLSYIV